MNAARKSGSLRRRLFLLLMLGAAIMAVLTFVVVQSIARQIAQESQDNVLGASVQSILDSASVVGGEVEIDLPYAALSMLGSLADERVFYAIYLDDEFLTGYAELPRPARQEDGVIYRSTSVYGADVRAATATRGFATAHGAAQLEVSIAQTLVGMTQSIERINRISMAVGVGFFVLVTGLAIIVAAATTRPLRELTGSISRRGAADLRPVTTPVPSEMVPMVEALNRFMHRLNTSLARSEDFIAEAAHRVRTPLAIVRAQAELTLHRVEKPENREAVRDMIRAIDESSRTAGQLLDHAMVTFRVDHLAQDEIDMPQLMEDVLVRIEPVSELRDIELVVTRKDPATIKGDAILVQNALRNVIDNAIKYAPEDSKVQIDLVAQDGQAKITVQDSGPGFPQGKTERMIKRFVRGDNAAGTVGSGLGLTIVQEVMQAHGGKLSLGNSDGGGGCVTLSFPCG